MAEPRKEGRREEQERERRGLTTTPKEVDPTARPEGEFEEVPGEEATAQEQEREPQEPSPNQD